MSSLAELEARIAPELERIEALPPAWLPSAAGHGPGAGEDEAYSVVICGAGLSGLGAAFGLKRRGVRDYLAIDAQPRGREGPWITSARMRTLRSPKHLSSVDLGAPSLTFRSWFEARYGAPAWEALDKPTKEDWMAYLVWFRRVAGVAVENDTCLSGLGPGPGGRLRLTLTGPDGRARVVSASGLILATGLDGGGGPHIPSEVAQALPRARYTHSGEPRDDSFLKGLDVVVLGGATSAFDWSATALAQGAATVTQIARRDGFARTEALAWMNFPGFMAHFADLPLPVRWRVMHHYFALGIPPTQEQYDRVTANPAFRYVSGAGACRFAVAPDGRIRIDTARGGFLADHLLLGTGYELNPALRPELRPLAGHVRLWSDDYAPPEDARDPFMAAHPSLGPGFELVPRDPAQDWIRRIHMFNAAALPSLGPISNGVTGLKYGLPRLLDAVTARLFEENLGALLASFEAFDAPHFTPHVTPGAVASGVAPGRQGKAG